MPRLSLALLDGVFLCAAHTALPSRLSTVCKRLLPPEEVKARGFSVTDIQGKVSSAGSPRWSRKWGSQLSAGDRVTFTRLREKRKQPVHELVEGNVPKKSV